MNHIHKPAPTTKNYITPGVIVLILIAINGLAFLLVRFVFGQKNGVVRVGRFDFEEKPRPIILSVFANSV